MSKTKSKNKQTIKHYFLYFMFYAIFGWIYEVFLEVVVYKWGFTNRGVLFGPYCPVYGFGALAFIFTIYKLIKDKDFKTKLIRIPIIFIGCALIATAIELVTSYICELIMESWPWQTYVDYEVNFEGRIALSPSLRFGLGGVIFLYLLQPLFEKLSLKMNKKVLNIAFYGLLSIISIDFIIKIINSI